MSNIKIQLLPLFYLLLYCGFGGREVLYGVGAQGVHQAGRVNQKRGIRQREERDAADDGEVGLLLIDAEQARSLNRSKLYALGPLLRSETYRRASKEQKSEQIKDHFLKQKWAFFFEEQSRRFIGYLLTLVLLPVLMGGLFYVMVKAPLLLKVSPKRSIGGYRLLEGYMASWVSYLIVWFIVPNLPDYGFIALVFLILGAKWVAPFYLFYLWARLLLYHTKRYFYLPLYTYIYGLTPYDPLEELQLMYVTIKPDMLHNAPKLVPLLEEAMRTAYQQFTGEQIRDVIRYVHAGMVLYLATRPLQESYIHAQKLKRGALVSAVQQNFGAYPNKIQETYMQALDDLLIEQGKPDPTAIYGLPGTGKTQSVLKLRQSVQNLLQLEHLPAIGVIDLSRLHAGVSIDRLLQEALIAGYLLHKKAPLLLLVDEGDKLLRDPKMKVKIQEGLLRIADSTGGGKLYFDDYPDVAFPRPWVLLLLNESILDEAVQDRFNWLKSVYSLGKKQKLFFQEGVLKQLLELTKLAPEQLSELDMKQIQQIVIDTAQSDPGLRLPMQKIKDYLIDKQIAQMQNAP